MKLSICITAVLALPPMVAAATRGTKNLSPDQRRNSAIEHIKTRGSVEEAHRQLTGSSKSKKGRNKSKKGSMGMMSSDEHFVGESVSLGDGEAYHFGVIEDDVPLLIGVMFTGSSLNGLPTTPSDGSRDMIFANGTTAYPLAGHEYSLFYPEDVEDIISPFEHTVINWNPDGHPPPMVYMVPHFDFHFYAYSAKRRETCVNTPVYEDRCPIVDPPFFVNVDCESLTFLMEPLPEDMTPPGYILVPGPAEAAMGNHLIPVTSAESTGGEFTHTWIYGVEGGNITFYEPMVTIAYLEWLKEVAAGEIPNPVDPNGGIIDTTDPGFVSVSVPILIPEAYPEAGMYPTAYEMTYDLDSDMFTVAMADFAFFEQSKGVKNKLCPGSMM